MRKGWVSESFDKCIKLKSGSNLTSKNMIEGPYPVYGGNGIAGNHNEYNLSGENIIIGRVGALCGNARYINQNIWLTDNAFRVSEFKFQFDLRFLEYILNYVNLRSYARQAAQPVISNSSLKDVVLEFPESLTEQKQIVAILDQAIAAIDQAKSNIQQNINNARELFQSKLNEVFSQQGDVWEEKVLDDAVHENCSLSYGIVQPGNDFEEGIPVVRPTDLSTTIIERKGLKLINPENAKGYQRTQLSGGELLLCVRGTTGTISIASDELNGANVTRGIVPIFFDRDKIKSKFMYFQFLSPFLLKQIKDKTYGAALMQINIRDVRKLRVRIPTIDKQDEVIRAIKELSSNTEKIIGNYSKKLSSLDELKKSILQRAFSGELKKLSEADQPAGQAGLSEFKNEQDLSIAAEPKAGYGRK